MLTITLPDVELFDDEKNEFIHAKGKQIQLEHSLISISKWESKWHKSFLNTREKTYEENLDYIKCMTLTPNVDDNLYLNLPSDVIAQIDAYINDPMTATTFVEDKQPPSREVITAELIYYWMIAQNIPFECQKWHVNKLLTLIRVCSIKNTPEKKMSKQDIYKRNRSLNAARRKRHHSKG